MKKILAAITALTISLIGASAQEAQVKKFEQDPSDLTAQVTTVTDFNGDPVAVVKVGVKGNGINFEGDIVKVDNNNGEYVLFMVNGATWLTIKGSDFTPLRYEFSSPLEAKKTYILDVQTPGLVLDPEAVVPITLPAKGGGVSIGGKVTTSKPVTFNMIRVKNGAFKMGGTEEQYMADEDEFPVHEVRFTRNFYIGETEVTQELWKYVMGSNPSFVTDDEEDLPVENISWDDAQEFCRRLSEIVGGGVSFRLPTEAEWEYAARGGHKREESTIYSGSNEPSAIGWYSENSGGRPHGVKAKAPNQLGIYDMSGNVWEMCQDYKNTYPKNSVTNYICDKPSKNANRVRRGGSFNVGMEQMRNAFRRRMPANEKNPDTGLRIVMEM